VPTDPAEDYNEHCFSPQERHATAWDPSKNTLPTYQKPHNHHKIMSSTNLFFSGEVVHIVGTNSSTNGRCCMYHDKCGTSLSVGDMVCFHVIKIVVAGAEDGIEVRLFEDGVETCRVGFLQRCYVKHSGRYDGKVAKVKEIWSVDDDSATKRQMVHRNMGCCLAGVMSPVFVPGVEDIFDEENKYESAED